MKKINLSLTNSQILLSAGVALLKICELRAREADEDVEFTAEDLYAFADRETLKNWEKYSKGSDSETRWKYLVKELKEYEIINQELPGLYIVNRSTIADFVCYVLGELCSRQLVIEGGLNPDGSIILSDYKSYCVDSDEVFFLSLNDLEKATTLFAEGNDIEELLC